MSLEEKSGYLLLDVLMSLIIISVIITLSLRCQVLGFLSTHYVEEKYSRIHMLSQIIDSIIHFSTEPSYIPHDISVSYTPIKSNTIQEKSPDYSFNFETNFYFVVVNSNTDDGKYNKKITLISSLTRRLA